MFNGFRHAPSPTDRPDDDRFLIDSGPFNPILDLFNQSTLILVRKRRLWNRVPTALGYNAATAASAASSTVVLCSRRWWSLSWERGRYRRAVQVRNNGYCWNGLSVGPATSINQKLPAQTQEQKNKQVDHFFLFGAREQVRRARCSRPTVLQI